VTTPLTETPQILRDRAVEAPDLRASLRPATLGAGLACLGALASGPLSLWLVGATHPQPPWQDAATFAASFHPIQIVPYLLGLSLLGGSLFMIAGLHALASGPRRAWSTAALVLVAVYATLVGFNYIVQTTLLPTMVASQPGENASIIATFSMSNPASLAWGLEMWGYGFLGVATWLVAPAFGGLTRALFVANGPVSIAGALWTVARPGWVMTPAGMVAFAGWNVLFIAMTGLAFVSLRRRRHAGCTSW
jgi:hypothetical protein